MQDRPEQRYTMINVSRLERPSEDAIRGPPYQWLRSKSIEIVCGWVVVRETLVFITLFCLFVFPTNPLPVIYGVATIDRV
jgi:hypothetical protein